MLQRLSGKLQSLVTAGSTGCLKMESVLPSPLIQQKRLIFLKKEETRQSSDIFGLKLSNDCSVFQVDFFTFISVLPFQEFDCSHAEPR